MIKVSINEKVFQELNTHKTIKPKIMIYLTLEGNHYIDNTVAYSMHLISDEEFTSSDNPFYGPLLDYQLELIKKQYIVQMRVLNIEKFKNKKKVKIIQK